MTRLYQFVLLLALLAWPSPAALGDQVAPELLAEEERRIEVIERIARSTIAVIEPKGQNGGSGVIITPDGYALTNFHVTAPCGARMIIGCSDGQWTEAVVVGLDPTGDIALIKLLGDRSYPAAEWGDSDQVQIGDQAIVAGNPFLLAQDFSPTISYGVISGVRRYQYPSDTILEYADCLQTDAAINPGNSGGPLFSGQGKLIGINGRGSFEKRGRVNVGVGYAVSANQIRRFLPMLRSGLIVDHASMRATVRTVTTEGSSRAMVDAIETASDAYERGLRPGDELLALAGRQIATANEMLNIVGALPAGWRIKMSYHQHGQVVDSSVRLAPLHAIGELQQAAATMQKEPEAEAEQETEDWHRWYEEKEGFANHYFTRVETDRLLNSWAAVRSDRKVLGQPIQLESVETSEAYQLSLELESARWVSPEGRFQIDTTQALSQQPSPLDAPGLLAGLWAWQLLGDQGPAIFDSVYSAGALPWLAGQSPLKIIRIEHAGAQIDFFFESDGRLIGFESFLSDQEKVTRVEFSGGYIQGLPSEWRVLSGNKQYARLRVVESEGVAP